MCGIAGLIQRSAPVDAAVVERMRDVLTHRGPDDAGLYISPDGRVGLGHRRLSIIDLSPLGHQPMCNEDGSVWIIFNGEIYNFTELRERLVKRGHEFRSRTDTEVILHAYEEFADSCVEELQGMFAFAIWDMAKQRIFLARDRFGIKPLYYYVDDQQFAFASELKALRASSTISTIIDRTALYDFLSYRYVPTPKTIFQHIHKLPAGHTLSLNLSPEPFTPDLVRYWDWEFPDVKGDLDEALRQSLKEAVASHLVSDVPLGVLLSGGVDSSTVVAILRACLKAPARTFSVGFDVAEHSETAYARQVADVFKTEHHEMSVSLGTLDEALELVVQMYDEPFADGSAVPTYRVCSLARQHVKVALSGDGADELFAGYKWYARWLELQRSARLFNRVPASVRKVIQQHAPARWKLRNFGRHFLLTPLEQYLRGIGVFTRYEKERLLTAQFLNQFKEYDDTWQLRMFWREDLDPLSNMQYVDLQTYLPDDILTKVDRASMAVSLEVRVPFLDHRLAQLAARFPAESRIRNGEAKYPLKKFLETWLPRELIYRSKQGFSAPWGHWLTPDLVRRRLQHGALVGAGILDPQKLKDIGHRQLSGGKGWALLVLDAWMAKHG